MTFGFKNKEKTALPPLTEEDIRNRLYGSAVGVAADYQDNPPQKKERSSGDKNTSSEKRPEDEQAKVKEELRLLKEELEQTKKRLKKMRGIRTKKIRLLLVSFVAVFTITILAIIIIRQLFYVNKKEVSDLATPADTAMRYAIQVAVYGNTAGAERFSFDLNSKGYKTFIKKSYYESGKEKIIVYVGGFKNRQAASGTLDKLKTKEKIKDSFIATMPG